MGESGDGGGLPQIADHLRADEGREAHGDTIKQNGQVCASHPGTCETVVYILLQSSNETNDNGRVVVSQLLFHQAVARLPNLMASFIGKHLTQ